MLLAIKLHLACTQLEGFVRGVMRAIENCNSIGIFQDCGCRSVSWAELRLKKHCKRRVCIGQCNFFLFMKERSHLNVRYAIKCLLNIVFNINFNGFNYKVDLNTAYTQSPLIRNVAKSQLNKFLKLPSFLYQFCFLIFSNLCSLRFLIFPWLFTVVSYFL